MSGHEITKLTLLHIYTTTTTTTATIKVIFMIEVKHDQESICALLEKGNKQSLPPPIPNDSKYWLKHTGNSSLNALLVQSLLPPGESVPEKGYFCTLSAELIPQLNRPWLKCSFSVSIHFHASPVGRMYLGQQ